MVVDTPLAARSTRRPPHAASAPPLAWNMTLASQAQSWASKCRYQHSLAKDEGENLAVSCLSGDNFKTCKVGPTTCSGLAKLWYTTELNQYNFQSPTYSPLTAHLTQMLWKSTTSIGCGVQS